MTPMPTFRFAPSPNGPLHLGHALSALVGHEMARPAGGRFLVRMEDIDLERSREDHIWSILEDLRWLGLSWEEPVLRQSTRFGAYSHAIGKLQEMGLLYPCWASRREVAEQAIGFDPDGAPIYPGTWRGRTAEDVTAMLSAGIPHALRIDMDRALAAARAKSLHWPLTYREIRTDGSIAIVDARPEAWGDAIIVRKETPASYMLSVVVDDAAQGITHVSRGKDLEAATGLQRLLQVLLDLPEPIYHHHRLILGQDGLKLSKSAGAESLAALRQQGVTPDDVRRLTGFTEGDIPRLIPAADGRHS